MVSISLASIVPTAAGNVYRQYVLQARDVDVIYATWWSGNFQAIWGVLFVWLTWIPFPGESAVAPKGTIESIMNTVSCMLGNMPHGAADASCASDALPPMCWYGIYLVFNLSSYVLFLWFTKKMSATWAQIATVACLNLTNICGEWSILAGGGSQQMSLFDWLATVLASCALWVYNLEKEVRPTNSADPAMGTVAHFPEEQLIEVGGAAFSSETH